MSIWWSRCPESMAQRARDSDTPFRRSSTGWMPARIGRLSNGVGRRQPVTMRRWWQGQWDGCQHYNSRQVRSTLLLGGPGLRWIFVALLSQHPNPSQQVASKVQRVMSVPCEVTLDVGGRWTSCPTLLRGTLALRKRTVVEVDFLLTFSFLIVEMGGCRHRSCSLATHHLSKKKKPSLFSFCTHCGVKLSK